MSLQILSDHVIKHSTYTLFDPDLTTTLMKDLDKLFLQAEDLLTTHI